MSRVVNGVIAFSLAALSWWAFSGALRVDIEQPIRFNHKLHVGAEVGLECVDCHPYYKTQKNSGRPSLEMCLNCHQGDEKNPELAKLNAFAKGGREVPWNRIYHVPGHVYFSHRIHAGKAEIKCERCHGAMAEQAGPPRRPLVSQTMAFCVDCHRESNAGTDCLTCHK